MKISFEIFDILLQAVGYFLGVIGFAALVLFEVLKCDSKKKGRLGKNPFFIIGTLLLIVSWGIMIGAGHMSILPVFIIGAVIAITGIVLYVIVLLATSKGETYTKDNNESVVCDNGIYGIIRHPGLWCFWIVSAGISLMFPKTLAISILFAVLNTVYIILQDIFFFPVYIQGYNEYKSSVPFCFPRFGGTGKSKK